MIVEDFAF